MTPFHPRPLRAKKPGGNALGFGDSLSDAQITVGGALQGAWLDTLATRHGWTRVGKGGAAPASATLGVPVASGGHVTSVPVTVSGGGYVAAPAVAITGGTFSVQATAHAILGTGGSVASIVIDNQGVYTVNPTGATIAAIGIASAAATSTVSGGAVTGLIGITAGSGYPSWGASATFAGGGTGAFADFCTVSGTGITGLVTTAGSFAGGTGYAAGAATFTNSNNHARAGIASTTLVHSGAFADCGIDGYQVRCVNANADVVTLWYGTNDYTQCSLDAGTGFATFNPTSFKAALSTVAAAVRAQASDPLLVLLGIGPNKAFYTAVTYPTGLDGQSLTSAVAVLAEFNRAIAEVAAQYGGVYVSTQSLNYAAHGAGTGGSGAPHLNAAGAAYVADLVSAALG